MKEESSPCPGNSLHQVRGLTEQVGSWGGLDFAQGKCVGTDLLTEHREISPESCHITTVSIPKRVPDSKHSG